MADEKTTAAVADKPIENRALEKKRTDIITTPSAFEEAITKWTGSYNLLSPFTQITGMAAQHGIIASVVKINPDPSKGGAGEVYDGLPFLNKGEVAIAKIGLRKIADAAGISTPTIRTDPRNIPNLWEFKCVASYRGIDGTVVTREATAEWDLRDGSPRLKGWTPNQISEGRKNGLRNAETRAINAAIREFGVKQKYTQEELRKPFLVLRVAFQPDLTDPEQRRIVAENAMRGTSTLYGGGALPAAAPHADGGFVDAEVAEPRHVGSGSSAEPAKSDPNAPPSADAVRIVTVDKKPGEKRTRYTVTDSNGKKCSTLDASIGEAAIKARDTRSWVEISVEVDGDSRELVEIITAGSAPKLPALGNL